MDIVPHIIRGWTILADVGGISIIDRSADVGHSGDTGPKALNELWKKIGKVHMGIFIRWAMYKVVREKSVSEQITLARLEEDKHWRTYLQALKMHVRPTLDPQGESIWTMEKQCPYIYSSIEILPGPTNEAK